MQRIASLIVMLALATMSLDCNAGLLIGGVHSIKLGTDSDDGTTEEKLEIFSPPNVGHSEVKLEDDVGDLYVILTGLLDSPHLSYIEIRMTIVVTGGPASFSVEHALGDDLTGGSFLELRPTSGAALYSGSITGFDSFSDTLAVGSYELDLDADVLAGSAFPGAFRVEMKFPGETGEFGGGSTVPEPSSWVLALVGILCAIVVNKSWRPWKANAT